MDARALFRDRLWLPLAAVLVPLSVLLFLQYRSLVDLMERTPAAFRSLLSQSLENVAEGVEFHYRSSAERTLGLPAAMVDPFDPAGIATWFRRRPAAGARSLFVIRFVEDSYDELYFYDPSRRRLRLSTDPEVGRAVWMAYSPLRVLSLEDAPVSDAGLLARDGGPGPPLILRPVLDENRRLVGVTGMILDPGFFRSVLVPREIRQILDRFEDPDTLLVTVRDPEGRLVYASRPVAADRVHEGVDEVSRPFDFLFTDWKLGIRGHESTLDEYAQSSFRFSVVLMSILGLLILGTLVAAVRAASREMRLSEMKSEFVSNVSHELRTPLASIRVFGEFLKLGQADDAAKVREYGGYIESESRRLTQLINNILDFSRIESGQKSYALEPCELQPLVEEVLDTFRIRLEHAGFSLDYQPPGGPLPVVEADREAIRQSLHNLLDNAVKYSGESRNVAVRLYEEDGYVCVSVRDFGVGIPRSEQRHIFDRFHRAATRGVHNVRGAGLGLAIVSHVIRAHRGRVRVESRSGAGSTFTLCLPVLSRRPARARREGGPAADAAAGPSPAPRKAGA